MALDFGDENKTKDPSNMRKEWQPLQSHVSFVPEIHIYDSALKLNTN